MHTNEILIKSLKSSYVIIDETELKSIFSVFEIVREENTYLSDFIRILSFENKFFIQEISFKKEILIRKMDSIEDAEKFMQERLDFYDRKWDGCGCKIDYYE